MSASMSTYVITLATLQCKDRKELYLRDNAVVSIIDTVYNNKHICYLLYVTMVTPYWLYNHSLLGAVTLQGMGWEK